eukprot:403349342
MDSSQATLSVQSHSQLKSPNTPDPQYNQRKAIHSKHQSQPFHSEDLEEGSMDSFLVKKLIKQQLLEFKQDFMIKLREDYDSKIAQLSTQQNNISKKVSPIADELQDLQQLGKSLSESILEYVKDNLQSSNFTTQKDLKATQEEFEGMLQTINAKMNEMDGQKRHLDGSIMVLKNQLQEKVDVKDLRNVEKRLQDCAPWDSVKQVYQDLASYVKRDTFDGFKNENNETIQKSEDQMTYFIKRDDCIEEIKKMGDGLMEVLKNYTTKQDFQKEIQDLQRKVKLLKDETAEFRKSVSRIDNDIGHTRRIVAKKADDTELQTLKNNTDQFTTKHDLRKIENNVYPKIQEFQKEMIKHTQQAKIHDDIIQRYDEIISEKASKWSLTEFKQEVNDNYTKLMKSIEQELKLQDIEKKVVEIQKNNKDQFDSLNKAFSYEIVNAVKKIQKKLALEGGQSHGGGISNVDSKQIHAMIITKANQSDVEALYEIKQHIRSSFMNVQETPMNRENKKKFLLTQLNVLAKWVNKYDPQLLTQRQGDQEDYQNQMEQDEDGKMLEAYTSQIMQEQMQSHSSGQYNSRIPNIIGIKYKTMNSPRNPNKDLNKQSQMSLISKSRKMPSFIGDRRLTYNNNLISEISLQQNSLISPSQQTFNDTSAEYSIMQENQMNEIFGGNSKVKQNKVMHLVKNSASQPSKL